MTHPNLPFGENGWQLERIPDIRNKVYVITGANSGIGYEATKELVSRGAEVVMLCRDKDKAKKAITSIVREVGTGAKVSNYQMDLSEMHSVRMTAEYVARDFPKIDAVINNAGLMMLPKYAACCA